MKFSAVISHPIQHYSPIFCELAKQPGVDVKIFYLCDHGVKESFDVGFGKSFAWDVPLTEGYDHEFLRPGFVPNNFGFWEMDSPRIADRLSDFKPDLIWMHGYSQRFCWRALQWAKNRSHVVYFGDSELLHARSRLSRIVKRFILPYFFSKCDAFITAGDNNEAYYRHYGVDENRLYRAACPIDVARFTVGQETRIVWRNEVRSAFDIEQDAIVVLFSGKMQDYKRPLDLVMALQLVESPEIHLLFIGDGPLRDEIEKQTIAAGLEGRVHVTGFINQQDIPKYIAAGDILAVTSERDAHPLAVSEALPFSLPIIASDKVGCVGMTDTARPNKNTLVYPCGDIYALAQAMDQLSLNRDLRIRFGEFSSKIAPTQDISVTVDTIMKIASDLL